MFLIKSCRCYRTIKKILLSQFNSLYRWYCIINCLNILWKTVPAWLSTMFLRVKLKCQSFESIGDVRHDATVLKTPLESVNNFHSALRASVPYFLWRALRVQVFEFRLKIGGMRVCVVDARTKIQSPNGSPEQTGGDFFMFHVLC